jgi:signal transduction histidine kinase/CheY-like chemotaxis protein
MLTLMRMRKVTMPPAEAGRLEALRDYEILDTPPEQVFDDIVMLAARICETPLALVSLVDHDRQWFKARVGIDVSETPRAISFCDQAIRSSETMVVPDAREDDRFLDNPLVVGDPRVRFYAGAPLMTPGGECIGTLCVVDRVPRVLSEVQMEALRVLARQVVVQLELRRQIRLSEVAAAKLRRLSRLQTLHARINAEVTRIGGTEELYDSVCRIAVELGGLDAAFAVIRDRDDGIIRVVASAAAGKTDVKTMHGCGEWEQEVQRAITRMVFGGGQGASHSTKRDPSSACVGRAALAGGCHSGALFPLKGEKKVIGGLALFAASPDFFKSEELVLLNQFADDVSFAVDFIEGGIKRRRAETALRESEEQMMRNQRMESIGTLAGGIAHDLNNVFTPIMMSIDLLKSTASDPMQMKIFTMIEASTKRGTDMVRQVLAFARGVEGQRLKVHLGGLLTEIENLMRKVFPKDIKFHCEILEDHCYVEGDPTKLHQVILNLCVNARDAMPGGGNLSLSAENVILDEHYAAMNPEATPGPYVIIQVEDTGSGMSPAVLDRIFEPFFTTKEFGNGTGLGLSTTFAIVRSHGGFVRVSSEPGVGTRFQVFLKTCPAGDVPEPVPAHTELPRACGQLVLVVEDETSIRDIAKQTLEGFGYRVLLASNGAEAASCYAVHREEIDVVIIDMMMPVMDGAATIRVLEFLDPQVRIIATSGLHRYPIDAREASARVVGFLSKPYTAETLLKTLGAALTIES